jgi:hypothetical protein
MKTEPTYPGNLLTNQLQALADGTLFYEHVFDGMEPEKSLYKKVRTCQPDNDWPEGDIVIEEMTCGQYGEVPGERCRLGHTNASDKEWCVVPRQNVEKMVGWLMTTAQYFED